MNHPFDLTELLRQWPEEPGGMTVRFLRTGDGRTVLQRRVPLGIFQMETTGRPDGLRPGGLESVLTDFRTRDRSSLDRMTPDDLEAAEGEALLYLQRAMAMAALGELDAVARDAEHVRVLATLVNGSHAPRHSQALARLRVQATLLAVRAEVARTLRDLGAGRAVEAIDRGLVELEAALDAAGMSGIGDAVGAEALRALRASIVPKLPASQREELRERLEAAILAENFELAAILRDELRQLG